MALAASFRRCASRILEVESQPVGGRGGRRPWRTTAVAGGGRGVALLKSPVAVAVAGDGGRR